jgi:hypothetical protein
MKGTFHEDQYSYVIISRAFLLSMRNVSDIICKENQNTFMLSNYFSKILPFVRQ